MPFLRSVGRRTSRVTGVVVLGALSIAINLTASSSRVAARTAPQDANGISAEALAQIDALLREKETRSPAERKIDSQLLYAMRMQQGREVAPGVPTLDVYVPRADDGHVVVDVKGRFTADLMVQLNAMSNEIVSSAAGDAQLHVDLDQLLTIAEHKDVLFVQPRQVPFTSNAGRPAWPGRFGSRESRRVAAVSAVRATLHEQEQESNRVGTGVGSVSSQADVTHRTALYRRLLGTTGAGVKIGVLSDGVQHLADAQASGDLGAVTVLPGQAGSGDEGTAMLELIHDIAPGAQLYFATGFSSITSFADNIRALRAAGCDIIVDDVFYFSESPFQDGQTVTTNTNGAQVIQAVKDVAASGALYFSSAGNSGNLNDGTSGVWEGNFVAGAAASVVATPGTFHRFTGVQDFNTLTIAGSGPITLFWADPLGASANDYDLFRLNSAGTVVAASSTNLQDGNDDPYEQMSNSTASPRIVIVKKASAAGRFLHLNTNRGQLSVATAGQTHGHAATTNIFSFGVAATYAGFAFPHPFSSSNVVETFSSDGPRRIFFLGDGTAITPGNFSSTGGAVLQKPDLTAADGVFVTGVGDFPGQFFGTSAAAPNAAAIAALIKSANPSATPLQLRGALLSSAIDIEAPGVDRDSGVGIVMAAPPQAGCTFTLAPAAPAFGAGGDTSSATVNASSPGCNWVVFSNVPWITITSLNAGTGSDVVGYSIARNFGPARTGTIMVQGGGVMNISQAGAAATEFTVSPALAIPDNTTVESSIVVAGLTAPITNVSVSFHLTHTFDADLTISLVAPDSTVVKLSVENGGSANNYGTACSPLTSRTTFTDAATNYITHGSAPFTGSFRPEQPLSAFNGQAGASANGTWKLRITDGFAGDTGSLLCWSLNINTGPVRLDMNGDNKMDLLWQNISDGYIASWLMNGPNLISSELLSPGRVADTNWRMVGSGDFNGDGKADIVWHEQTQGWVGIWLMNGLNLVSSTTLSPAFRERVSDTNWKIVGVLDLNQDGKPDILWRDQSAGWLVAWLCDGLIVTSSVALNPERVPDPNWQIRANGDFNGDGKQDIIWQNMADGYIAAWFMNGINLIDSVLLSPGYVSDTNWKIAGAGDFDGDGKPDLVWQEHTQGWIGVWLMNGITLSGSFAINPERVPDTNWKIVGPK